MVETQRGVIKAKRLHVKYELAHIVEMSKVGIFQGRCGNPRGYDSGKSAEDERPASGISDSGRRS
jgi:hypothetical protein